jgi:hypothetical protein
MSPVRSRRQTQTIEFWPPADDAVIAALTRLRTAGDGWMNLLPGIDEDAVAPEPQAGLFAFFGNRAAPVTMATVIPPKKERRHDEGVSVGLMHPTGGKAVARLAEAGTPVPDRWVVQLDHVRRGLVLRTPPNESDVEIVSWCVHAGTALCRVDMTGQWRAVVYLPE